jgi:selenocysteine lyase/cysteine desulfurase
LEEEEYGFGRCYPEATSLETDMELTRRDCLTASALLPFAASARAFQSPDVPAPAHSSALLPDRTSFAPTDLAYLDSGTMHPVSLGAQAAVAAYLRERSLDPSARGHLDEDGPRLKFARLINAEPDEIAFVQSTTMGEQIILKALGLPSEGAHIVTDTLHFFGSFPLYEGLAKQGCEVTWLRPKDGRIAIADMQRAVRKGTRLVALSLVSTYNGFEHDLKAVCDLAHSNGALVYADIIHAAGCVPIDVRKTGVDFAACASYKWLMGDFGLGFLFARKDRQQELARTQFGYYGIASFTAHAYPYDPPSPTGAIADYSFQDSAMGHFAYGTYSHMGVAQLSSSLDYIMGLGVERIQTHSQRLTERLKSELPRLGYRLATPPEARTPIVTCVLPAAREKLKPRLDAAKVRIMLAKNRFRVTPSVFNDMGDIDRLLEALGRAPA